MGRWRLKLFAKLLGRTERRIFEDEDDDYEDENKTKTHTPHYDNEPGSCSTRQRDQLQGMATRSCSSLFDE
jgi:hypothetical protein